MLEICEATTQEDLDHCIAIRREVFVQEQNVPEAEEVDGKDPACRHLLARLDGTPVATLRLMGLGDTVKVQRVAVLARCRGTGLGARLMEAAMENARQAGFLRAKLGAQTYAIGFYEKLGFTAEGPEYLDAGIPHRDMIRAL
jgi:ElaA protein